MDKLDFAHFYLEEKVEMISGCPEPVVAWPERLVLSQKEHTWYTKKENCLLYHSIRPLVRNTWIHLNSLFHFITVFPLAWTSAAIGTTLAVFLAVICLTVFLRIRWVDPFYWIRCTWGTWILDLLAVSLSIKLLILLIRKKKTAKQSAEPEERPDNAEQVNKES